MNGTNPEPRRPRITAQAIRTHQLPPPPGWRRRAYDADAVDRYLERISEEVQRLNSDLAVAWRDAAVKTRALQEWQSERAQDDKAMVILQQPPAPTGDGAPLPPVEPLPGDGPAGEPLGDRSDSAGPGSDGHRPPPPPARPVVTPEAIEIVSRAQQAADKLVAEAQQYGRQQADRIVADAENYVRELARRHNGDFQEAVAAAREEARIEAEAAVRDYRASAEAYEAEVEDMKRFVAWMWGLSNALEGMEAHLTSARRQFADSIEQLSIPQAPRPPDLRDRTTPQDRATPAASDREQASPGRPVGGEPRANRAW